MKCFINKLLIISLSILVFSCGNSEKEINVTNSDVQNEESGRIKITPTQFEQINMTLGKLEDKSFPEIVETSGMIDVPPQNKAIINAKMGGFIKSTPLLVGDVVKKGQVLLTIENPEFVPVQQSYLEIKEQLNYLKSEYDRQKILFDEKITSRKNYLKAESNYKSAQATYNGLRKQLTMYNISPSKVEEGHFTSIVSIYAPIEGSITKINVSKGAYVSPSTNIMEIIDNEHIHLELSVFEKDILKIEKGQKILFKTPEASDKTYKGTVYLVGSSIEENRTIKIHGHPINESNRFLTGMYVNAEIVTDSIVSKALPDTAFVEIGDYNFLLRLMSESEEFLEFEKIAVKIGASASGFTIIENSEQFKLDDQFLTKGAFDLIGE